MSVAEVTSQIFEAVEQNDCSRVMELILSNHCNPRDISNDQGESLLHIASQLCNLRMVRLLVEVYHCKSSICDNYNLSPTDYALVMGHLDLVLYFKVFDLHKATCSKKIPLIRLACVASQFGNSVGNLKPILFNDAYYIICKHLGAAPFESLHPFNDFVHTLKFACDTGNIETARLVLDELANGMFINSLNSLPSHQKTAVSALLIEGAYRFGHDTLANYLVNNKGLSVLYHSERNLSFLEQDSQFSVANRKHGHSGQRSMMEVSHSIMEVSHSNVVCKTYRVDHHHSERSLNFQEQDSQFSVANRKRGRSNRHSVMEVSHSNAICETYRVENHQISQLNCTMAIHSVVLSGNLAAIKNLLQAQYYAKQSLINAEGDTVLHIACVSGRLDVVQFLVNDMKFDINCKNGRKSTPLHVAIEWGSIEVAKFLLDNGCVIDIANDLGQTPLYFAVMHRRVDLCQFLINKNVNVNVQATDSKETPLHLACCYNSATLATLLLECVQQRCQNVVDAYGDTPLFNACRVDSIELQIIHLLVEKGCDPFIVNNTTKETPFHIACRKKRADIIEVLINGKMKEPINICNYVGMSLLHLACYNDDEEMVQFLLSNNICNVNELDKLGVAPLHIAAQRNLNGILKQLLNSPHYSDIQIIDDSGNVPLHHICKHEVVEKESVVMLASDATITHQNNDGCNPLHIILSVNYGIVSIQCLLSHPKLTFESKKNALLARDVEDNSPLHLACRRGNSAPVLCLLNSLSFSSELIATALLQENAEKDTPLHLACNNDHIAVVDCVLGHATLSDGCIKKMVTKENKNGNTILHIICHKVCADMLKCILSHLKENVVQLSMTKLNPYDGKSPLYLACEANSFAVVTSFLQFGFSDDLIKSIFSQLSTTEGNSLLHAASKNSQSFDIPKLLINQQLCNIMHVNKDGDTALHLACRRNNAQLALFLCESDCNPHYLNKEGKSPASLAIPYLFHRNSCDSSTLIQMIKNGYCNWKDPVERQECHMPNKTLLQFINVDSTSYCYTAKETPFDVQLPLLHSLVRMFQNKFYPMNELQPVLYSALQSHLLSPNVCDSYGNTVLHLCAYIDQRRDFSFHQVDEFDIFNFVLQLENCDANIQNQEGNTPLHIACLSNNDGRVRLLMQCGKAEISMNIKNTNGCLPIHCASSVNVLNCLIAHGANIDDVTNSQLAEQIKHDYSQFKNSYPLNPAVTVLVIGNSSAGKTTLIKSLKSNLEMTLTDIVDVGHKPTAGVVKYEIESKEFGKVIFYDFAGQPEYESSHSALLQSILSSSTNTENLPVLFFLVVDVTAPNVIKHLHYWLSFVQNCPLPTTAHVIVVGSHVDCVSIADAPSKAETIKTEIEMYVKKSSMTIRLIGTPILVNCRKLGDTESQLLKSLFTESKDELKKCAEIDHRCYALYAFLLWNFQQTPVKLGDLVSYLKNQRTYNRVELPTAEGILLKLLETMHARQHLLLFKEGAQDPSEYWILTTTAQNILYTQVNGVLFAPESVRIEKRITIKSSVGVIPSSTLKENFRDVDFEVLQQFLVYNEFCQKIEDHTTLQLIEGSLKSELAKPSTVESAAEELSSETHNTTSSVSYFFFPGLVKAEKPKDIAMASVYHAYTSGWCLECPEGRYFTIQFLQVLLLRCTFSFATKHQQGNFLDRKCIIWKNGIFWGTTDGVEALVELIEQNTVVVVLIRCLNGHEMSAVKLRADVISKVLAVQAKHCPDMRVSEYIINRSSIAKFEESQSVNVLRNDKIYIAEVAVSISNGFVCVQDTKFRPLHINKNLLHFEPYAGIGMNPELLASLFDPDKANQDITEKVLSEYANLAHEAGATPHQIGHMMSIPSREIQQSEVSEPGNLSMQIFRLFLYGVWSYRSLQELFDSYSIFRGRNPLVSHLIKMLIYIDIGPLELFI